MTDVVAKGIAVHQRFGKLTVSGKQKLDCFTWIVAACDCGEEGLFLPNSLRSGKRTQCDACHQVYLRDKTRNTPDLIGQKFGKLTVVQLDVESRRRSGAFFVCRCDCGNTISIRANSLRSSKTVTCGCGKYGMQMKANHKAPQEASWASIAGVYRKSAGQRGLIIELSIEDIKEICTQNCHYCGSFPSNNFKIKTTVASKERARLSALKYNGIDRLDSSVGYTKANCVPCCKICNYAKLKMSKADFLQWIKRVYTHSRNSIDE